MEQYRAQTDPDSQLSPAEKFIRDHKLKAVIVRDNANTAVVDHFHLYIGHELDGFTLVSVGAGGAVFEGGDSQRVILKLKEGFGQ